MHDSSLFMCINVFNPFNSLVRQAFTEEETTQLGGLICPGLRSGRAEIWILHSYTIALTLNHHTTNGIKSRPFYSFFMCHPGLNDPVFQDLDFIGEVFSM